MSVDRKGVKPNDMFWEYVQLQLYSSINYRKAERYIVKLLRKGLAEDLYYHSLNHMRDVCNAAEEIAHQEGVKGEDLFLLKTAALFHDAGFIHQYMNNEPIACEMAREVLPRYGYSKEQLDVIEGLIMATCVPQQPKNHLEEIICDADLDYLGRTDFHPISDSLRREFLAYNVVKNDKQWDEIQIKFLSAHKYFTASAKKMRTKLKLQHLEQVKERYAKDEYKV
jgi:predicted metal-dependent HD superfamily phosphohydrolase